jgi:hypothetical protein
MVVKSADDRRKRTRVEELGVGAFRHGWRILNETPGSRSAT